MADIDLGVLGSYGKSNIKILTSRGAFPGQFGA
jgi:hypothetical protein